MKFLYEKVKAFKFQPFFQIHRHGCYLIMLNMIYIRWSSSIGPVILIRTKCLTHWKKVAYFKSWTVSNTYTTIGFCIEIWWVCCLSISKLQTNQQLNDFPETGKYFGHGRWNGERLHQNYWHGNGKNFPFSTQTVGRCRRCCRNKLVSRPRTSAWRPTLHQGHWHIFNRLYFCRGLSRRKCLCCRKFYSNSLKFCSYSLMYRYSVAHQSKHHNRCVHLINTINSIKYSVFWAIQHWQHGQS